MPEYRSLLVPYDFSAHARAALHMAAGLAGPLGADLHVLHVVQAPSYIYAYGYGDEGGPVLPGMDVTALRANALSALTSIVQDMESLQGVVEPIVVEGTGIADSICNAAEELEADLIVMGTHGRTGLARMFLGSVAERTLRIAPCPVLSVRTAEAEQAA
jgi:universal stress protein A